MFRKYYKEANNDIKPSEELLGNIIENARKRRPPLRQRYMKYAASLAAAVVVVSAAVIAMPVWQKVTDKDDGLIIEESITQTAPPSSTDTQNTPIPNAFPEQDSQPETAAHPPENTSNHSYDYHSSKSVFSQEERSSAVKSAEDSALPKSNTKNEANTEQGTENGEDGRNGEHDDYDSGQSRSDSVTSENRHLKQEVAENSTQEAVPERTPPPAIENASAPVYNADASSGTGNAVFYDQPSLLPTPQGYNCVSTSWDGYTFVSDDGAVITVKIKYGGDEDSEPYYSEDGSNIFASFTAYGMTVTVSASGADMSTVEEIINSLK